MFGQLMPIFETFNYEMGCVNVDEKRIIMKFIRNTFLSTGDKFAADKVPYRSAT
jgi:hypothetical protein